MIPTPTPLLLITYLRNLDLISPWTFGVKTLLREQMISVIVIGCDNNNMYRYTYPGGRTK